MTAKCVTFHADTFTPATGDPVPLFVFYLDVTDFPDLLKLTISSSKVSGSPSEGAQCYVDFRPRFGSGGRVYYKPSSVRFNA